MNRLLRKISNLAGLLLLVAAAWTLWPTTLGGRAQFVVVRGESMEPLYHSGDLLYARSASDWQLDDIAVYALPDGSPSEGSLVVHRITAINADGSYRLTGDNRTTEDDAQPTDNNMVAKPIANLGSLPTRILLLTPLVLSLLLGCAVAWFLWPTRPEETVELASGL